MKKIFTTALIFLLGIVLYAGPVTPEKAMQVAQKFFDSATPATKASSANLKIVWDGSFSSLKRDAQAAFYVVARDGGGFVIVSGNDNVKPILGFSLENKFTTENMPANVKAWMQMLKSHAKSDVQPTQEVRNLWAAYTGISTKVEPVTTGLTDEFKGSRTNMWNQTNPGNYYCPKVSGEEYNSVCGCVAVAAAEVMAWFGTANLSSASGTVPAYTTNTGISVPAHTLGTVYDWDNLKKLASTNADEYYYQISGFSWNNYGTTAFWNKLYGGQASNVGTTLTTLGYNVAQLLYDIGTLLQADYSYNGTSAYSEDIASVVGPAFGYNNTARFKTKDGYTNGQWMSIVKSEIAKHPVVYDGVSSETGGGHAYVADGYATYNGDLMFHFNLGWGGQNNGYYTLDFQEDYDLSHGVLVDYYPNPSSSAPLAYISYANSGGLVYSSGYNTGSMKFAITNFYNYGAADFTGSFYIGLINAGGTLVASTKIYGDATINAGYGGTFGTVNMSYPNASLGDRIIAMTKEVGSNSFVPYEYEPMISNLVELPIFPAAAIKKESSYSVGDYFVFELMNHEYLYTNATWVVTDPDGVRASYTTDDYQVKLTKSGEYKIESTTPGQATVVAYITVQ